MDKFISFLSNISTLSASAQEAVKEKLVLHEYPKNHILIKELSLCNQLYFIEEGLVRVYYLKDGKEITEWFGMEQMIIGPVVRNYSQKPGPCVVELLEKSKFISIHFDDLQKLFDAYHEFERIGRLLAIQAVVALQHRLDSIQFETAHQRYNNFLKTYPSIINRAPLGHIASYLGITQVTLSRIRTKV